MTAHVAWLKDTGKILRTVDGRAVEVWALEIDKNDRQAWSAWAKHFREHYIKDSLIDAMKSGTPYKHSKADYLRELVFPDASNAPGPSIRAGDFAEILVSDLLQYVSGYYVPRTRFANKSIRNESAKGTDIIGMKFASGDNSFSANDELIMCEAKAQMTGKPSARLQDAVNDSIKDQYRLAATLNAAKQRMHTQGDLSDALKIERFQDRMDNPYLERYAAAAILSSDVFDEPLIGSTDGAVHPSKDLRLIVIHADAMMQIVSALYEAASDEA